MGKKKSKKGKKKGKGGEGDGDSAEAVAAARAQSELLALRSKLGDFFCFLGGGLFNQNMSRRLWRASQIPFAVECGRSAFLTLLVTA